MEVILPWEHYVCSECYQENPYAIWLVKQRCFKPHRHRQTDQTLVIVDKESTAMVQIRPLPGHYDQFRGEFALCHHFIRRACRYGSMCRFAHLKIEKDTWNIKKRILKGNDDLQRLQNIIDAGIQCHSPSEVCVICCKRYNNAIWLAWLLCVHPEEHMSSERCNTVVDKASVVRVRELPSRIRHRTDPSTPKLCQSVRNSQGCPQGDTCCFAHSMGELNYWKWCLANNILDGLDEEFQALCHEYVYPTEASIQGSVEEVTRLAPQNYQEQYHKLVYLDELAHSRKMIQECNGTVGVEVPREQDRLLRLTGLNSGAIDYAIHGHAVVHLSVGSHTYTAAIEGRDDRTDTLLVHVHDRSFSHAFRGQRGVTSVSAHFEINHYYFRRLHEAIQNASHIVVKKLLPKSESFPSDARGHNRTRSRARYARSIGNFTLDREYQTHALERMLSSDSNAPFLLLGPFGTGKTHLIAAAVVKLLDSSVNNKVLVCTHQNVGADNIFGNLQRYAPRVHQKTLRLVPSEKVLKGIPLSNSCKTLKQVSPSVLNKYQVIITTFLTALSIKEMCGPDQLSFTHILIDEGAQSREPEALGAVVLANQSTKLIIVGDNQQIGPQVAVLSDAARKNGLGTPLIERLYARYQFIRGARRSHTTTLLTNYRSHPSILMLASSLFYQCTLLSRSTSEAHPKAPYPILFACTSLDSDEEHFCNLPAENAKEAELLVTRMLEFVREWPVEADQSKPTVGLLASTRKQVTLLRQKFNQRVRNRATLPCLVDIKPTYIIQGEEFTAVFLSTCEPTDGTGQARDPVRSICNEQVFNTLITRARSLIFTAGNPFLLHHMGKSCDVNCWAEYVQRCIQCQTLHLPEPKSESEVQQLPRKMKEIFRKVFYSDVLDEATQLSIEEKDINAIVERYIKDLHNRKEFRIAHRLVQDPRGNMRWEEADPDYKQNDSDDIEWCVLDCKSYHTATAVPLDSSKPPIEIEGIADRRLALHRDRVKVDMKNKCVLLDDQTEKAVCETHFGTSFLCQVDPKNPIMFFPLDKRNPKFVNLPTLTRQESNGVVCFDPQSLNDTPKMNNFIPVECAVKMLFIVKFLGWRKRFPYPLGIIVGALPRGNSPITGDMVLRIAHNVPLTPERVFTNCNVPVQPPQTPSRIPFPDAFTIDPEGSTDHDDALTCEILKVDSEEYRIGVHITNVQKYVPKGSDIDDIAAKRGCAVYSDPTNCICKMLPESIVDDTSLLQDKQRAAFSVLARVILKNGTADSIHSVTITESGITSKLELSYPEAQSLINNGHPRIEPTLTGKMVRYNSSRGPGALTIETQLQILWKVASFLRYQRLGKGAYCFPINEPGEDQHPEAHYLVEELMIWANTNVAKKLLETFPDSTVIRTQARPNERQLQSFIEDHGPRMATSFSLRRYAPQEQPQCESVQILKTTLNGIQHAVRTGNIKKALHFVQFEHLHPQLAVAHNCFRQVQSPSNYQVSVRGEENYRHDTLRCNSYTHFTSPIRRFIDIAIQRMLHAALNGQKNPYAREELEDICTLSKEAAKRANDYEREMKRLRLAGNLQQNSREFTCFITMIEEGKLFICYPDLSLQKCHSRDIIHLKNLNATSIPQQNETEPVGASVVSEATTVPRPASWRAKVSSLSGSLQPFLANRHLQLCPTNKAAQQKAEMSIFVPERGDEADSDSQLVEKKLLASVLPFTHTVPLESWSKVQDQLEKKNSEILSPERLLQLFSPGGSTEPPQVTSLTPFLRAKSPLWIYTVNRLLQPCEVMQVQLCASSIQGHRESASLTPRVQLLEVAPNLRICIQHNSNPVECFIDRPTHIASRKEYNDLRVYWTEWEKVLLAEAAYNSLTDSELLLVRDVTLTWPKLAKQIDSSGQVYYRLPVQNGTCAYVEMELPKSFMKSSYEFFQFTQGDLVCVRYDANDTKCVFHMVVHKVLVVEPEELRKSDEVSKATVYLKFVSQSSNYISHKMEKSLSASGDRTPHCEVQLIPLTLPYRRIYKSLRALQSERTLLAESIALGKARIRSTNSCNVGTMLSQEDGSIATSLWPLQYRSDGKGRLKLNPFQRKAIDNAFSSDFSMVQGPPGTGKSVTGAHLAFALAMMLRKQSPRVAGRNAKDRRPSPCVLYCGPSQHSVDVVLDMLTSHDSPVKKTPLKIIRIYSKEIEKSDFAGLKQYSEVFRKKRTDVKCEAKYREYALHHLVHEKDPTILTMERDFERYYDEGKIPSCKERKAHRSAVDAAEKAVLMDGVDIVLCTCNEASSHRVMEGIKPGYCIVDECAMATEPECMVPIRRAEHVVLIGDHMQLQPVIKYKDAADMGLGVSLFERYVKMNVQLHMLQVQYRMHPSICEFPSVEFYEGKLKTDEQVAKKRRDKAASLCRFWPQWEKPFVFCDIIGTEKEEHTGQKGKARVGLESKYNEKEARQIVHIAKNLIEVHRVSPGEIAVLTPYSAQKAEIRKHMERQAINGVEVKTITDSQGSEYGIVLLSTVRSRKLDDIRTSEGEKKKADIGWIRANLGFITDKHRICVGITRCKYGLVIVGNKVLLSYDSTWNRLIEHYHRNRCIKKGSEFPATQ